MKIKFQKKFREISKFLGEIKINKSTSKSKKVTKPQAKKQPLFSVMVGSI